MEAVVQLEQLTKYYGSFCAVNGLNLMVPKGEVFGFLGPNGAGKSTTLRMMLSLIQPTSGSIRMFGKDLYKHRNEVLRRVGCIVEKPDFYLYISAIKNLQIFATMSGMSPTRAQLEGMLEFVGLKGRENDKVRAYSHGMKQRLGLAQTLIHNPDLVILDEPTTGLDPQGIIDLRNLILQLKNEQGKTVVLSSHILSEIELIADSMVIINKGKAVVQGKVNELLSNEDLLVDIEVVNADVALQALRDSLWAKQIKRTNGQSLTLNLSKQEIPSLQSYLHDKQVAIYSLSYRRTLEDFFLKLTSQN